jgi:hypothetical protein
MRVVSARASADGGFLDDELLFALYDRLRGSPHWAAFNTRTTQRLVQRISFSADADRAAYLETDQDVEPDFLQGLDPVFETLFQIAERAAADPLSNGKAPAGLPASAASPPPEANPHRCVPIQAFICLYRGGEPDACPAHVHDCRQITMSLGAPRWFHCWRDPDTERGAGEAVIGERAVEGENKLLALFGNRGCVFWTDVSRNLEGPRRGILLFA